MSKPKGALDYVLEAVEISGPPKVFILTVPSDKFTDQNVKHILGMLDKMPFRANGHTALVLREGFRLGQATDEQLRVLGLMRIMRPDSGTASPIPS